MFDKLKNLNIETCSEDEIKVWMRRAFPVVDTYNKASQKLAGINSDVNVSGNQTISSEGDGDSEYIFIANGRKLPALRLSDINKDDFDVIMDTTTNSLRLRKNPAKNTKLKKSKLEKTGPHRMQMLAYMLEHPGKPFYYDNIYRGYTLGSETRTANTFTKTISALREVLGQNDTTGPYIVKEFDWDGITGCDRGYVYKINKVWRYLLIRHGNNSG